MSIIKSRWGAIKRLRPVRLLVMDCDGTMTDGDILHRRYDAHDGHGLAHLKIHKAVISGYGDSILERRAQDLGIGHIIITQDKLTELSKLVTELGITYKQVCYIGDDMNDLECIKVAGVGVAVHDAVKEVKRAARYITRHNGGHGAIREITDMIRGARHEN